MWIAIICAVTWFVMVGFNLAVVSRLPTRGDKDGYYLLSMTGPIFTLIWWSMFVFNKILGTIDPDVQELRNQYRELWEKHKDLETERDSLIVSQMQEAMENDDGN